MSKYRLSASLNLKCRTGCYVLINHRQRNHIMMHGNSINLTVKEVDESDFHQLQQDDMSSICKIGSGSTCDVYEVAFKERSFRGHERAAAKRLNKLPHKEIEIMSRASHPHIVQLLAYVPGMSPLLVMELADHGTLRKYLDAKRGSIKEPQLEQWVREVCDAIEYLHDGIEMADGIVTPVVHHDIKASNCLLFGETLTLKLSDFSISKPTGQTTGKNFGIDYI